MVSVVVQLDDYLIKLAAELPSRLGYSQRLRRRFLFERLAENVDEYLKEGETGTLLLPGLRGTGKTTLLGQLYFYALQKTPEVLYLPVDELHLLGFTIYEAVERYVEIFRPEKLILLLDEVHYDPRWDLTLKVLHDRRRYLTIATGSSAIKLRESPDLARRAVSLDVEPLTFLEYLHLTGEEVQPVGTDALFEADEEALRRALETAAKYGNTAEAYLRSGSLPVTLGMAEREAHELLMSLTERIIYLDLRNFRGFDASTIDAAMRLLVLLSAPKGERFSYERLSKSLGIGKATVVKLVRTLIKSGLLIEIPPVGSTSSKVRKSPKLKFSAPAIRAAILSRFGIVELGALLEDATAFYLSKAGILEYEPKKGGADFVLLRGGKRYVIEVGLSKKSRSQVGRSMERLKADMGIVVGQEFDVRGDIISIPWRAFLALL